MMLSERARKLAPSVTLQAAAKAKKLKAQGNDVKILTVGEPDFATPKNIQDAAIQAIQSGKASYYTATPGIPQLRKAIENRFRNVYGIDFQDENIVVTDGAKFALYSLFQAILNEGDEVLIPVPYWVSYAEQVKLAEATPVFVYATEENDYKVTVEQLEEQRTENTRAVIINSPSNPTGMIYSYDELKAIGEWAVRNNVLIVADDIYGRLVYNGNKFTPIASISEEIRENTVIINGVSKAYAMTGWRIGFAIGNEEIIKAMIKIGSQSTSNPTAVSQFAALEALNGTQEVVEEMRQSYEERLNEIYPKVAALPGFKLKKPQGAFYLFPNIKETLDMIGMENATEFVDALLEEEYVALVTGDGFGSPYNVRLSYATDLATLNEAVDRIARFIESKKKEFRGK
ncbi:Aspartate/methionine/tyrosine aminotransferase [Pilibacter termitis]|uniref:Aminotransferase n=1 Tax=Pilibacter termitis TaxID=263852 RepID=A0A1T4MXB4_9ENTE|nr:pyridoxal phosphate-dependent aminotransferase [Pilibacter termitis]SJZ71730.1 Aspartate/methionine/tyrosine aminotransferase [Pilibacter termitis]